MKKAIKIVLKEGEAQSKAGSVFEELINTILINHQYKTIKNIHITGLEIDLLAEHKIRNEILYAECKAREKPKSNEIKNFIYAMDYGIDDKMPDYGYFIHTTELDRQAAGLKIKLEKLKPNITFIGPELIISELEDLEIIKSFKGVKLFDKIISKLTLLVTVKGYFYVPILQEGSIARYYTILDHNLQGVTKNAEVEYIRKSYNEIADLNFIPSESNSTPSIPEIIESRDTITEIKQSENWYDYTPASVEHFIGRLNLKRELRVFLDSVRKHKTSKRIFFLDGKSGWGKSSLLAELNGFTKISKYWKHKVYSLAVDTRSASSANFVGLAFKKLIDNSIRDGFLERNLFKEEIEITSPFDVLSHASIREIFNELKIQKKVLVIIFDQFEDQFRNESLFNAFYQFCKDVDSLRENLIVGFSWKTEINVPIGNNAHPKFNQLRDYSHSITIPEFSQNDAKQVVRQLEDTINARVGIELERKLIESSQGFPWLIKKLCIHALHQFNVGKSVEDILEEELNYKELFENDLIKLDANQNQALNFIAQRAFDGNPFDVTESDKISQDILDALINERLIIRTGGTYNIYWDIFRDFIVTKTIPVIGESYLLRQSGNTCLEVFLIFKKGQSYSIKNLIDKYPSNISQPSISNVLIELRSLGIVRKTKGEDIFQLTSKIEDVSKEFFSNYIKTKFNSYTPVLKLQALDKVEISLEEIVIILKEIFKTEVFQEKTWLTYARNLVIWIKISGIDLINSIAEIRKGRGSIAITNKEDQLPFYSPSTVIQSYRKYLSGENIHPRKYRDLVLFDLVDEDDFPVDIAGLSLIDYLHLSAISFTKIEEAHQYYATNQNIKTKDLIKSLPNLFVGYKTQNSKNQVGSILLSWATFMYAIENNLEYNPSTSRKSKGKYFYLSFSPKHAIKTIIDLDRNSIEFTPNNKKKIKDLVDLQIVNDDTWTLTEKGLVILNSLDPDLELAKIAQENTSIKAFLTIITNFSEEPEKKKMKLNYDSEFFKGMSDSSVRIRSSVYKSWAYFIMKNGSS